MLVVKILFCVALIVIGCAIVLANNWLCSGCTLKYQVGICIAGVIIALLGLNLIPIFYLKEKC